MAWIITDCFPIITIDFNCTYSVVVKAGSHEILLDRFPMGAAIKLPGLVNDEHLSFLPGGNLCGTIPEDIAFLMVFQSCLEHGSHSSLDVQAVLGISSLDTDLVFDVTIVEVKPDSFVDVVDWTILAIVWSEDLEVLQTELLVAVGLLGEVDGSFNLGEGLLAFCGR